MSGIEQRRLWRPANLPWRAKKKGTDNYVWYEILDCDGWEVAKLGAASLAEAQELLSDVALILTKVNGSTQITIDDEEFEVWWGGESPKGG